MYTDVQIINLGLSKLGSSRIKQIDPPKNSLESFCAENYEHWRRSEISKRRWVCAIEDAHALALVDEVEGLALPFKYLLPTDCLRPIRRGNDTWTQKRRFIHSDIPDMKIDYVADIVEGFMDEMLVDVLACRIAVESCEYVTQSNTKKADQMNAYREAVKAAGMQNAYVIGPEDVSSENEDFITGRL